MAFIVLVVVDAEEIIWTAEREDSKIQPPQLYSLSLLEEVEPYSRAVL